MSIWAVALLAASLLSGLARRMESILTSHSASAAGAGEPSPREKAEFQMWVARRRWAAVEAECLGVHGFGRAGHRRRQRRRAGELCRNHTAAPTIASTMTAKKIRGREFMGGM